MPSNQAALNQRPRGSRAFVAQTRNKQTSNEFCKAHKLQNSNSKNAFRCELCFARLLVCCNLLILTNALQFRRCFVFAICVRFSICSANKAAAKSSRLSQPTPKKRSKAQQANYCATNGAAKQKERRKLQNRSNANQTCFVRVFGTLFALLAFGVWQFVWLRRAPKLTLLHLEKSFRELRRQQNSFGVCRKAASH